jgi:hypothetical protein
VPGEDARRPSGAPQAHAGGGQPRTADGAMPDAR